MSRYLSTSQVSKIIGTSIHNIRYYEKEGLLHTPNKSEKGYRLFSFKDIEALSTIMMLRYSEIPIKNIKDLFANYDPDQYVDYMKQSLATIEAEIKRLEKVKGDIDAIIEGSQFRTLGFYEKEIASRKVMNIKTCPYDQELTEREFYDFYIAHKDGLKDLNSVELVFVLYDKKMTYCLLVDQEDEGKIIEGGYYLCYRFLVASDEMFDQEAETFLTYIDHNKLKTQGDLLLKEVGIESFNYQKLDKAVYEYQIRIK